MKRKPWEPWADKRGAKRNGWRKFMTEDEQKTVVQLEKIVAGLTVDLRTACNDLRLIRNRCCTRQNRGKTGRLTQG